MGSDSVSIESKVRRGADLPFFYSLDATGKLVAHFSGFLVFDCQGMPLPPNEDGWVYQPGFWAYTPYLGKTPHSGAKLVSPVDDVESQLGLAYPMHRVGRTPLSPEST